MSVRLSLAGRPTARWLGKIHNSGTATGGIRSITARIWPSFGENAEVATSGKVT